MAEPGLRFWVNHFYSHNAGYKDCCIFIATMKCRVNKVRSIRTEDEYGSLAVVVSRLQGTEDPDDGSGDTEGDALTASIDLKSLTKNTATSTTVITTSDINVLEVGDRVALTFTGTPYAIVGLITVEMEQIFT